MVNTENSSNIFTRIEKGWLHQYRLDSNGSIAKNDMIIDISIENIGNGIAIELSSQVDTFPSSLVSQVIRKDESISLKYDLQKVIYENLSLLHTSNEYKSFIKLNYRNILGKEFTQVLDITLTYSLESYMLTISISEVSCQKINI